MTEYVWYFVDRHAEGGPRYREVMVLGWHETTATVLDWWDDELPIGATPYLVRVAELKLGHAPKDAVPA